MSAALDLKRAAGLQRQSKRVSQKAEVRRVEPEFIGFNRVAVKFCDVECIKGLSHIRVAAES